LKGISAMSETSSIQIETVGLLSPGDMGHAIGAVLIRQGLRVVTALEGRSERTRRLAAAAGIADVGGVKDLVGASDLLLSVLVPAAAEEVAGQVAAAASARDEDVLFADCNAIAPQKARAMDERLRAAGGRFIDAAIIGGPPRGPGGGTRIYASGPHAPALAALRDYGLDIRVIDDVVGHASALKMCYAALTKGLTAIGTELLVAAQRLGVDAVLAEEMSGSQKAMLDRLAGSIVSMPSKAHRWIGEMEEIAATFGAVGLTPRIYEGAADMYRFVAETPLGRETPEERDRGRSLAEVIAALAADE
jgi:3-hydroxyisobutyrate dehydrogenase-like beta-hydroxyacid dehydrogenase